MSTKAGHRKLSKVGKKRGGVDYTDDLLSKITTLRVRNTTYTRTTDPNNYLRNSSDFNIIKDAVGNDAIMIQDKRGLMGKFLGYISNNCEIDGTTLTINGDPDTTPPARVPAPAPAPAPAPVPARVSAPVPARVSAPVPAPVPARVSAPEPKQTISAKKGQVVVTKDNKQYYVTNNFTSEVSDKSNIGFYLQPNKWDIVTENISSVIPFEGSDLQKSGFVYKEPPPYDRTKDMGVMRKGGKPIRKSLDKCTVEELKARAAKRGIKVTGLKKAEIIAKLRK